MLLESGFWMGAKGGIEGYRFKSGQGKFLCSIRNALLLGRGGFFLEEFG